MTPTATLHICSPPSVYERRITYCPNCGQRRRFVGLVALWYLPIWTCCSCGDSWDGDDGSMRPRPFARGWRKRAIAAAREHWSEGLSRTAVSAWLTAEHEREERLLAEMAEREGWAA